MSKGPRYKCKSRELSQYWVDGDGDLIYQYQPSQTFFIVGLLGTHNGSMICFKLTLVRPKRKE